MAEWKQLESDIIQWLSGYSSGTIEFRNSYQAIIGFPSSGFRSDGMLTDSRVLIAVEIEAGQTHPDTNTGKYWLLSDRYKQYEKIVLFHIYTPAFSSYGWRKKLAEFYIEKMLSEVPIEYIMLDYRDQWDYNNVLANAKISIRDKIKSEFK